MNILVTGGAGFIGSTLVDKLLAHGHQVTIIDDLRRGHRHNLVQALSSSACTFIEADVNTCDLTEIFTRYSPEVIIHLAAQIDVRSSVANPLGDLQENVHSTISLCQAAVATGTRKIVLMSSGGAIYGEPATYPVTEAEPVAALSPYAASKASAEIYVNTFRRLYGLECSTIAPSNVYGPRQDPHGEAGVVAIFSTALLHSNPTTVFGEGTNTRDYVFVDDVVDALIAVCSTEGNGCRYNIGTAIETSDRELHTLVAAAAHAPDNPSHAPARMGDVARSCLDYSKAKAELGWQPQVTLTEGIVKTVAYFSQR